jgi:hypothetical protein
MKKYNISVAQKYTKDGVEKTYWANVGTLVEFEKQDGTISRLVEIPAIGLKANAFPIEPKEDPNRPASFPRSSKEDITPEEIPF